jgi:hypothetical protein
MVFLKKKVCCIKKKKENKMNQRKIVLYKIEIRKLDLAIDNRST